MDPGFDSPGCLPPPASVVSPDPRPGGCAPPVGDETYVEHKAGSLPLTSRASPLAPGSSCRRRPARDLIYRATQDSPIDCWPWSVPAAQTAPKPLASRSPSPPCSGTRPRSASSGEFSGSPPPPPPGRARVATPGCRGAAEPDSGEGQPFRHVPGGETAPVSAGSSALGWPSPVSACTAVAPAAPAWGLALAFALPFCGCPLPLAFAFFSGRDAQPSLLLCQPCPSFQPSFQPPEPPEAPEEPHQPSAMLSCWCSAAGAAAQVLLLLLRCWCCSRAKAAAE